MSGGRARRLAASAQAARLGHVLGPWERDTRHSTVAECTRCGRLAAVDVEWSTKDPGEDPEPIYGRALTVACREVPHGNGSGHEGQARAA